VAGRAQGEQQRPLLAGADGAVGPCRQDGRWPHRRETAPQRPAQLGGVIGPIGMTLTGIADKIAAQTLLTGSREQTTAVLHLLRADTANHDLFLRASQAPNEGLLRGHLGIALLQRHLTTTGDDANALKLLLQAAEHIGDQATLDWGSGLMLKLDPHN